MSEKVVALGFFDGVHIGHGALFKKVKERAAELSLEASVLTYMRHPSEILAKKPVKLINTAEERKMLIEELYGINNIIMKDFTKEYADLSCEEFISKIIIGELCARHVVAGFDFRFGKGGAGDAETLIKLCREKEIGCDIIPEIRLDGAEVSSSRIRELIAQGEMEAASRLLGHSHCIMSEVQHGAEIGSSIGFPTANQTILDNIQLPKFGVYISNVVINGRNMRGITNIGVCPTVSYLECARAETHIPGFSGNLYGKNIKVELIKFIREERRFDSLADLREQIARDIETAIAF